MTPERQNEIWAMLPNWFRKHLRDEYNKAQIAFGLDPNNVRIQSHIRFMEKYFGRHNLTAQAEEKPKEPKFNIGEKVRINCYSNGEVWDAVMHNKIVTIQDYYVKDGVNMYVLKEGCRDFGEHCLEPYTEPKEGVETSDEKDQNSLDVAESVGISDKKGGCFSGMRVTSDGEMFIGHDMYQQYRLDLAKELAVAMIRNTYVADEFVENIATAAKLANEIVKRLKETEE